MQKLKNKHILFIVENLPVPFDRRVWQEATTLKDAGFEITIICPIMNSFTSKYENIDGIDIYRHPLPIEANAGIDYLWEYSTAIFWWIVLSIKIFSKKKFHLIHGCNPPDLIFIVALIFKPFGVKYVFDHHDVNPELYIAKFGKKDFLYKCMVLFEKSTFKVANYSIATNESYRNIAIERGGMDPEKVQIVRSGPKIEKLIISDGNEKYRKGRKFLVGYVGTVGEQEGIDFLLKSILFITKIRQDVQFAIIGGSTMMEQLICWRDEMGLKDFVDFYGRVSDEIMLDILNTAVIGVNPDKPTEMNNLSTMNKIMEYMALKKPIVQFDLKEGRYSAQNASLYAIPNDTTDFANKIIYLLENENIRKEMGDYGFNRVKSELSWEFESKKLIDFYSKISSN